MDSIETLVYITFALLFLGVLLAFSPTIIITEIAVLTKSKNPFFNSLFLMAGVATPIILFGIIAVKYIDPSARITIPQTRHILDLLPILDVLIGILFIIGGLQVANKSEQLKQKKSRETHEVIFTPKKLYWFGCIRTATRLSGLAVIVLAAQLINQNIEGGVSSLVGLLWLTVVALVPLVVLVLLQRTDSKYFTKISTYSDKVASLSWRKIISVGLIAIGVIVIVYGIFFA